jgi:hypothetical protein
LRSTKAATLGRTRFPTAFVVPDATQRLKVQGGKSEWARDFADHPGKPHAGAMTSIASPVEPSNPGQAGTKTSWSSPVCPTLSGLKSPLDERVNVCTALAIGG